LPKYSAGRITFRFREYFTLMGLLGTIFGLKAEFGALATADLPKKQTCWPRAWP